jgi:hypothetical protein
MELHYENESHDVKQHPLDEASDVYALSGVSNQNSIYQYHNV